MLLRCGTRTLDLSTPAVMGVLNVTPDSFSDGGRFSSLDAALAHAQQMIGEGARIIDVGGESTRPGATPISIDDEKRRVLPIIEAIRSQCEVVISVDTRRAEVAQAALSAGADLVNDVTAASGTPMLDVLAASNAAVCLMHMQGDPLTMQVDPRYGDVVGEVSEYLRERMERCVAAGIDRDRIVIDPGIGFGKRIEHNLTLLARLKVLCGLQVPVLIGVSRKSMFKQLLGRDVHERLAGGVAVAFAAVLSGAAIVRTHDVAPTLDAVKVALALRAAGLQTCDVDS